MKPTFITTGECTVVYSTKPDKTHQIDHYKVGRKDMDTIHISNYISEYGMAGKQVYIDKYGSPWVKRG